MTEKEKLSLSRFMSLVLRHKPEAAGISLDPKGWADTEALIAGMTQKGRSITLEQMQEIVDTDDKQRYKFSEDFAKIRANQGHSVAVDVELKEAQPPDILYHGTAARFVADIKREGLNPGSRLYVHLSGDVETALKVGQRHGAPVLLVIDAARMCKDGWLFYLSENSVWLTPRVPPEYIINWGEA